MGRSGGESAFFFDEHMETEHFSCIIDAKISLAANRGILHGMVKIEIVIFITEKVRF